MLYPQYVVGRSLNPPSNIGLKYRELFNPFSGVSQDFSRSKSELENDRKDQKNHGCFRL